MRRTALLATIAVALAGLAAIPVAGLAAGEGVVAQADENGTAANETSSDVAPGERLTGILGVQEAEVNAEVESRAFGIQVARAATDRARADVVAERLAAVEDRLDELEQRKEALERARENGSLSEGAYRAQIAELAAEKAGAERLTNQSTSASEGLPADLLESHGINASAIRTLKERADELGGQEVAEIARSIAGPSVGNAPDHAGPPEETDRGDGRPEAPADGTDERPGQAGNATADSPSDRGAGDGGDRGDGSDAGTEAPTESGERTDGPDAAPGQGR